MSRALTKEEQVELSRRGWENPIWFCEYFLAKWFPSPLQWFQKAMLAILLRRCDFLEEDPELDRIIKNFVWYLPADIKRENPLPIFRWNDKGRLEMVLGEKVLMLIPRGFSKTTLTNASSVFKVCYQVKKFLFYTSKTGRHATRQLTAIGKQFTENRRIRSVFGEIAPKQREGKWSESEGILRTTTGRTISACGAGGQVRGTVDDGQRPDELVIDDLEDKKSVKSDLIRKETFDWLFSDLIQFIDKFNKNSHITMLANLIHNDCAAANILSDPSWTCIILGAYDLDGNPIWPDLWSEAELEAEKKIYALKGKLHIYYMELFNELRNPEDAVFKPENIWIYPATRDEFPIKALALDPSFSDEKTSDYVSAAVVGLRGSGPWHVYESISERYLTVQGMVNLYLDLYGDYMPVRAGVETQGAQVMLKSAIEEAIFQRKDLRLYHDVIAIQHKNTDGKIQRVEGKLQMRYAMKRISHQAKFPELETMLLDWPSGKKDAPDAMAMAIGLLDEFAGFVGNDEVIATDSMKPLDELYGGDWRGY